MSPDRLAEIRRQVDPDYLTAIHEIGHWICLAHFGYLVTRATITGQTGHVLHERYTPTDNPVGFMAGLLAGATAECIHRKRPLSDVPNVPGCEGDIARVQRIVQSDYLPASEMYQNALEAAYTLLVERWDDVVRLADELLREKTLTIFQMAALLAAWEKT